MSTGTGVEIPKKAKALAGKRLLTTVGVFIYVGLPVLAIMLIGCVVAPLFTSDPTNRILVARLALVALGVVIGFFQTILGVLLALLGATSEFEAESELGGGRIRFVSASPGLLLAIMGNVLIRLSLQRPIEYSQTTQETKPPAKQAEPEFPQGDPVDVEPKPRDGMPP